MTCDDFRSCVARGGLLDSEVLASEKHAGGCPLCTAYLEGYESAMRRFLSPVVLRRLAQDAAAREAGLKQRRELDPELGD